MHCGTWLAFRQPTHTCRSLPDTGTKREGVSAKLTSAFGPRVTGSVPILLSSRWWSSCYRPPIWYKSPRPILSASATLIQAHAAWTSSTACPQRQPRAPWPHARRSPAPVRPPAVCPGPVQMALPCCGPCLGSGKMSTNNPVNRQTQIHKHLRNQDSGPCVYADKMQPLGAASTVQPPGGGSPPK